MWQTNCRIISECASSSSGGCSKSTDIQESDVVEQKGGLHTDDTSGDNDECGEVIGKESDFIYSSVQTLRFLLNIWSRNFWSKNKKWFQILLSIFWYARHLGAAYYDTETAVVQVLLDTLENDQFFLVRRRMFFNSHLWTNHHNLQSIVGSLNMGLFYSRSWSQPIRGDCQCKTRWKDGPNHPETNEQCFIVHWENGWSVLKFYFSSCIGSYFLVSRVGNCKKVPTSAECAVNNHFNFN